VNRLTILGAALVFVLVAVVFALGQRSQPASALATATPAVVRASQATASPASTPGAPLVPAVAMPPTVLGDWHADKVSIDGITGPQLIRLALNWDGGKDGWIQLDGDGSGRQVLQFTSIAAPNGQIGLRAGAGAGCNVGDVGFYVPHRSADGLFLSFEVNGDQCATRAQVLTRTWVHSLSAVTDGGLGVLPYDDQWLEIAMPKQRFGASGFGTEASWLHPMSDADPNRYLMLMKNPMGFDAPCITARKPTAIRPTTSALEAYLKTVPGLSVKSAAATVDGIAGRRIDVAVDKTITCATGDVGLFHSMVPSETDADRTMPAGETISLWATVVDGNLQVFGFGGEGVTRTDAHAVLGSFKFLTKLPTP
jgi:hypothetical protein